MDAIDIRTASPDDVDAVERYHHLCFMNTSTTQISAGKLEAPDRDGMRQQFSDWFQPESEFETWVAVIDHQSIGHVTITAHHLVHLFVEPDHHGTGLGRRLLDHGEATIAAHGHSEFELQTRVDNFAAIGFYEAAGWTLTERVILTVEHGISDDECILVKHV